MRLPLMSHSIGILNHTSSQAAPKLTQQYGKSMGTSRNLDGDSNVFSEEYGAKLKEGDQIFLITYSNESYTSKAIGD